MTECKGTDPDFEIFLLMVCGVMAAGGSPRRRGAWLYLTRFFLVLKIPLLPEYHLADRTIPTTPHKSGSRFSTKNSFCSRVGGQMSSYHPLISIRRHLEIETSTRYCHLMISHSNSDSNQIEVRSHKLCCVIVVETTFRKTWSLVQNMF